jgi:hypothetical protein
MPSPGDNITIPCEWVIEIDMNPVRIGAFEILGDLTIPDTQDILI